MRFLKEEKIEETTTSRIYSHITNAENWAIISPYRSENTLQENRSKMAELKSIVRNRGYGFTQFISRWVEDGESFDEESLLIPNCKKEDALELGERFKQSSVIIKDKSGCKEICTTAFETYKPGEVVREYNVSSGNLLNIEDAKEIFAKRKGGPASKSIKGKTKPFHLSELYIKEDPRPSYFQNKPHKTLIYKNKRLQ